MVNISSTVLWKCSATPPPGCIWHRKRKFRFTSMALAGTRVWHFLKPTLPWECAARGSSIAAHIHGRKETNFAVFITLLPVRNGTVRPEVGLRAGGDGFGDFSDLGQLFVVQFYTQAGAFVGIEFPVFEVQTLRQVGQGAALVVVLHQDGTGERAQAIDESGRRDRPGEMRNDTDEMSFTHGGDLHHFGNAAYIGQGGANIIYVVIFDKLVEVPAVSPLLASG